MQVLIVESNASLCEVWGSHMRRLGAEVAIAQTQDAAIDAIYGADFDVIVLDLMLDGGSAIAVADFASYRCPSARIVFVTANSFFSDGSIFNLIPNAAAFVKSHTPPEDLAAIVEHHAAAG